jgi:hypothetical protein
MKMITSEMAKCDYCGMEYMKERLQEKIQEIKGTVRVDGISTIETMLFSAENSIKLRNFQNALSIFDKIIETAPERWEGYWGVVRALSREFTLAEYILNDPYGMGHNLKHDINSYAKQAYSLNNSLESIFLQWKMDSKEEKINQEKLVEARNISSKLHDWEKELIAIRRRIASPKEGMFMTRNEKRSLHRNLEEEQQTIEVIRNNELHLKQLINGIMNVRVRASQAGTLTYICSKGERFNKFDQSIYGIGSGRTLFSLKANGIVSEVYVKEGDLLQNKDVVCDIKIIN